ncbi:haloacid dehalogenase type II [Mycobacterium sp. 236(2023)]|uniref:haloacid dehalogenase type II n=1 Tax=Mycobacterium sp. 236(2023) TaxID=3038163 RepID=UPI0024152C46|nr:haloacid dehalogenase type II [Mycobacterium sp. 236(2023)]MDG4663735.1 haloacid dehalogenase type II [Mycobacterium sp. 236(2023)]
MTGRVIVFDVNETLLDIESLTPVFDDIYGDPAAMREWFAQLVLYSMTLTLSQTYVDFFTLGRAVAQMLADTRGVTVSDTQLTDLASAMSEMPAHPDVEAGLTSLREAGHRLVTLTNSPTNADRPSPLDNAGLAGYFERQFSVDPCRAFKPDPAVYRQVCADLDVPPADCTMVAAHVWDTIGAQAFGMQGALITRPGNATLRAAGIAQPDFIATDLPDFARQLGTNVEARRRPR